MSYQDDNVHDGTRYRQTLFVFAAITSYSAFKFSWQHRDPICHVNPMGRLQSYSTSLHKSVGNER